MPRMEEVQGRATDAEKIRSYVAVAPNCTDITNMLKLNSPFLKYIRLRFKEDDSGKSLVTTAISAFANSPALPDNMYPKHWDSLSNGKNMFLNCSLLSEETANAILDSLPDWSGEDPPASHVITFTGTAAETAWAEHASDPAAMAAINKARSYGWTVEGAPEQADNQ